jgi:tetratricopeptide (TPR) repeat protein
LNVGATADYVFAEKAIFLASLGPCVLIGEQVARARSRNVIVSLFMVVVLIYGVKNITRAAAWKDTLSYLSTVTTFEPRSPMFQVVIGDILYEKGENEKSLEHYLLAHKFYPDSAKVKIKLTKGYLDLGYFALENGDTVKAEASFLAALKYDGSNYGAAEALLKLYLVQNRYEEAEQFLNAYLSFLGEIPLSLSKIQAELAKAPRLVKKGHD